MTTPIFQLALDRFSIEEAINIAKAAEKEVDWLEIGTSLVKEFGMESVRAFRRAFPNKILLADTKTIDNAIYEAKIAYEAGADIITVMGCGPEVTIELVAEEARKRHKDYMIDLLNTTPDCQKELRDAFPDAVFCLHTSKDVQEHGGEKSASGISWQGRRLAVAGGIKQETIGAIAAKLAPEVYIIGGAITKQEDPLSAAKALRSIIEQAD
jgi:3-hexulose-6-phosphate synthase